MRLIDADELKRRLLTERNKIQMEYIPRCGFGVKVPSSHGMSMRGGIRKALRCMEETPTVDTEFVSKACWVAVNESEITGFNPEFAGCDPIGGYECSHCGSEPFVDWKGSYVFSKYCPNCGAKMDGGAENG